MSHPLSPPPASPDPLTPMSPFSCPSMGSGFHNLMVWVSSRSSGRYFWNADRMCRPSRTDGSWNTLRWLAPWESEEFVFPRIRSHPTADLVILRTRRDPPPPRRSPTLSRGIKNTSPLLSPSMHLAVIFTSSPLKLPFRLDQRQLQSLMAVPTTIDTSASRKTAVLVEPTTTMVSGRSLTSVVKFLFFAG